MKLSLQAYCVYFQLSMKNGPCVPYFRILFDIYLGQNLEMLFSFTIFWKRFHWIHTKVDL